MKSGPAPIPVELKILRGNPGKRKLSDKPRARRSRPSMPAYLNEAERAAWREIVPELDRLGLLTKLDRMSLVALCESWAQMREAAASIKAEGVIIQGAKGMRKHPAWQIYREALQHYRNLAQSFGLTPADRARLSVPEKDDGAEDDLLD